MRVLEIPQHFNPDINREIPLNAPYQLNDKLVAGISSRALFDMEQENEIFATQGEKAYTRYQREHENVPLAPGTTSRLVPSARVPYKGGTQRGGGQMYNTQE